MKNRKILRSLALLAAVVVAATLCFGFAEHLLEMVTGAESIGGMAIAAAGLAVATAEDTNRGTIVTAKENEAGDVIEQSINQATVWDKITQMYQTTAIFDSFLRIKFKNSQVSTKSFKFEYWSVGSRGIQTKVAAATTAGTVGEVVKVKLADVHMLSLDNNIMIPTFKATGPDAEAQPVANGEHCLTPLVLHIVKFDPTEKEVTVFPINAKSVPALAADTVVYRMGTAKDETAAYSVDPTQMPFDAYNYAQIRMLTLSESIYQRMADKKVSWGMADMVDQAIYDFRLMNEIDALFGARGEFPDPVTRKIKHTMGGLTSVEGLNTIDMSNAKKLTNALVNNIAAEVFFGNNGSDRRILLMGKDAAQQMQLVESVNKQLAANNTEAVGGMKFKIYEALAGTFNMIYSPVLDLVGQPNLALAIDPDHVFRVEHKPMEEEELDLDKAGISRSKDVRMDESWTLAVTNAPCHAKILFPPFDPSNY